MSAAAEFYGWLLTQGYGENQLKEFATYAEQADRGEISHNKAYRKACKAGFKGGIKAGYSNMTEQEASDICEPVYETQGATAFNKCREDALKGRKGSFTDWMQTAKEAGWIDTGIGILGGWLGNRQFGQGRNQFNNPNFNMQMQMQMQEEERRRRRNQNILIGSVVVIGIGAAIYFATKKKD
jgi:hypothetical protein